MKKEAYIDLIPGYFDGTLTKEQLQAFEDEMKVSVSLTKEVEAYKILFDAIEKEEQEIPSKNLEENFLKMLEEEKANQGRVVSIAPERKNWGYRLMKVAASIAALISIFYLGRYSQSAESESKITLVEQETIQAKQMAVLAMMENQSANKRVQGVQFVEELSEPDPAIIKALADRLQFDDNNTVRMAALEALSNFQNSEVVKKVFLKTLETEKNPSIQIALIQSLVTMREKKAIEPMKKLLEQEDTQPFIKNEINQALPKII